MSLQRLHDLVHVRLDLVVARLQGRDFVGLALEEAEQPLLLFRVEALEFRHDARDEVARLSQVLGAHPLERGFGKIGHLLLSARPVGEDLLGVGQVDLLGERLHLRALLVAERICQIGLRRGIVFDDLGIEDGGVAN